MKKKKNSNLPQTQLQSNSAHESANNLKPNTTFEFKNELQEKSALDKYFLQR